MARIIESTTDTQEELERAFAEEPEVKPEEKASKEAEEKPEAVSEEDASTEDIEAQEEPKEDAEYQEKPDQKHKSNKGYQKRIDKLTREKYEREARVAELERKLQEISQQQAQPAVQQTQQRVEGKPRLDQFQNYNDYVEALADWKFEQRQIQAQAEAAQRAQMEAAQRQQEELREKVESYKERVASTVEKYADWDEVTKKNVIVPEAASMAIIESENGPDVTYYLGKHPEVIEELHDLTPVQQISRIAAISYEIAHPGSRRVQTKAPAPVQPVGGSSQGTTMPPEPTYKDYRNKWLREQNG